jgi:glutathione peroxidase
MMKKLLMLIVLTLAQNVFAADCPILLNRTITTLQGDKINLCQYAGKPILVVNTASRCGFTPQFDKLEAMYSKFGQQGLLVLGFPSNDFKQELATNGEIANFCKSTYKVKFPMSEPSIVTGTNANDLFKALAKSTGMEPQWNFHKYLISADGKTVYSFATEVEPDSNVIMDKIKPMLN